MTASAIKTKEGASAPQRRRRAREFDLRALRMREIENLIRHRYQRFGGIIPDVRGTDDVGDALAFVHAAAANLSGISLETWCTNWTPWLDVAMLDIIDGEHAWRKAMMSADEVARLLGVTSVERDGLKIRTIGCIELTRRQRARLTASKKRDARIKWCRRDRLRKGARPHSESARRMKPWEAEGISRATWYRQRARETSETKTRTSSTSYADLEIVSSHRDTGSAAGPRQGRGSEKSQVSTTEGDVAAQQQTAPQVPTSSPCQGETDPGMPAAASSEAVPHAPNEYAATRAKKHTIMRMMP